MWALGCCPQKALSFLTRAAISRAHGPTSPQPPPNLPQSPNPPTPGPAGWEVWGTSFARTKSRGCFQRILRKCLGRRGAWGYRSYNGPALQVYTGPPKPMFSLRKWWFFRFGSIPSEVRLPTGFLRIAGALRGVHFDLPEAPFSVQDGVPEG